MCFTIEIKLTRDAIENRFGVESDILDDFQFRYFYRAFDHPAIPVVTAGDRDRVRLMRWGLIPSWTRDARHAETIRKGTYNARGETMAEKPAFRNAFRSKRCWVIVHGFFEWEHRGNQKIPWYIRLANNEPFAMAGLYDSWRDPDTGTDHSTFSIVTCPANPMMEKIHNTKKRMPAILIPENEETWLDPDPNPLLLQQAVRPVDSGMLAAHPVGKGISLSDADPLSPEILREISYPEEQSLF